MHPKYESPTASEIARSPRERVLLLASRIGGEPVATWCAELLSGAVTWDDPRRPSIVWLGGRHAAAELNRQGLGTPGQDYWPRVWAARGLMYVWHEGGESAVVAGLRDHAWRVREMSAKVARRHAVARAEPILTRLLDDPVLRVRSAAEVALTESARSPE